MNVVDGVVRRWSQGRGVVPATSAAAGSTSVVLHTYGVATIPGSGPAAAAEDEELDRSTKIMVVDFSGETPQKYAAPIFRNHTLKREIGMQKGIGVPLYI